MSVRFGLLAVLDRGPCYGYQLKHEFETRTGGSWPVSPAQVYSTLERLERDGLITALDEEGTEQRRFEITADGHEEVQRWFTDPIVEKPGTTRNELPVKLALALTLPDVDAGRIIAAQRRAAVSQLQELNRVKRSGSTPPDRGTLGWDLLVDSLIFAAEAQVRWLDQVEAKMGRLAREGVPLSYDLEKDLPGRGRPRTTAKTPEARES